MQTIIPAVAAPKRAAILPSPRIRLSVSQIMAGRAEHVPLTGGAMAQELLAIGSGAGFAGGRWDSAGPVVDTLIARGGPAALTCQMLGERMLALALLTRE